MGTYETIRTWKENGVRTILLNRPERRNALNPQMMTELGKVLEETTRCNCGVVILTGAGSAFCAGLDLDHLRSLQSNDPADQRRDAEAVARVLRLLYDFPKPTIAAVNGAAIAGGAGIATVCDFTLAVPEAKFGYTEVRIGFVPAIVSSFLLRQIGEKRTRDLLLTGRLFNADHAQEMGLVTQVVKDQDLLPEAHKLAQSLLRNSPEAMQSMKKLLSLHARARLDMELEAAVEWNAQARTTRDFSEGVQAFLEKRAPKWPSLELSSEGCPDE